MELVNGWEQKKFADVLEIRNGRNQKVVQSDDGAYPILGSAGNVMGYATEYICEAGSTIIGRKGNISNPIYVETKFWNVDTAFGLSPKDGLDSKFLYYYCLSFDFAAMNRGTTIPSLVKSELLEISIIFPPLPEQKRIVAILDEAFAGISQAVANAEKNLANARELFDSYLNEVFTRKGEGWIEVYLEDVLIEPLRNGWSPPAKNHSDEGTPVLTLSSVTGFKFDPTKRKFTSALINKNAHYWANHGDLLMTRSNTPMLVGHVAICEGLQEPTIYPDLIMKLKINGEKALTSFVYYQLRSQKLRELIMERAQGANPTMKKINKESTQSLPISLPAIELQKNIVTKLDRLLQEANELESVYQRKLAALVELKQAILQKAFTGELTAQKSPLDVDGVSLDVQREELVAVVREGRERD